MANVNLNKRKIMRAVKKDLGDNWFVGSVVNYAAFQEFLGPPRATPYLRPSLKELKKFSVSNFSGSLNDLLGSLAFEVERRAKEKVRVDTGNLKGSIAAASGESEAEAASKQQAENL